MGSGAVAVYGVETFLGVMFPGVMFPGVPLIFVDMPDQQPGTQYPLVEIRGRSDDLISEFRQEILVGANWFDFNSRVWPGPVSTGFNGNINRFPLMGTGKSNPIWMRDHASGQAGPSPHPDGPFHEPVPIKLQLPTPFDE